MFNLILFGPPGSGKGTQSEKLIEKYGWIHLSTGNLLRKEIEDGTRLGLEAKSFMDKGQLVPDEVVIGMISSALDANAGANGFLFDGFPRTVAQAEALDELLAQKGAQKSAWCWRWR
jgi:Adenylate kinase and related kinases